MNLVELLATAPDLVNLREMALVLTPGLHDTFLTAQAGLPCRAGEAAY
jgi:hypothetical protein